MRPVLAGERGRAGHVEHRLHARGGHVRVLAARPGRAARAQLDLGQRNCGVAADPKRVLHGRRKLSPGRGKLPAHASGCRGAHGVVRVRPGAARAEARRDSPRRPDLRGTGWRRRGRGRSADEARRQRPPSSPPSATTRPATAAAAGSRSWGSTCRAAFVPSPSDGPSCTWTSRRAHHHGARPPTRPTGGDQLDWAGLDDTDAVYLTAGDADAVRHARRARCSWRRRVGSRRSRTRTSSSTRSVASGRDPGERYRQGDLDPRAEARGAHAGRDRRRVGDRVRRARPVEAAALPGPIRDAYGCRRQLRRRPHLRARRGLGDRAGRVELAARCGAACMTGQRPLRGPAAAAEVRPPGRRRARSAARP